MLRSKQRLYVVIGLLVLTTMSLLVLRLSQRAVRDIADGYRTLVTIFLGIFIEALPFLLLGTLASGLVEEFLSREALGRLVPRSRLGSTLTGALMGLAFPVCECGVVPLTRRLFRKGLPLPMGVAFLLAAPVINPVVIASTYAAFGWGPVLLGRVAFTLLIAMTVGLIFGLAPHPRRLLRFSAWPVVVGGGGSTELTKVGSTELTKVGSTELTKVGLMELTKVGSMELTKVGSTEPTKVGSAQLAETGAKPPGEVTSRSALSVRLTRALIVAGDEFFEMGRYLVLGSLLAAGMQTVVPQSALLTIGRGALSSVLAMLALAFVLSVCSTVDAFVALAFVNTFTTGSILGFLVFGPMVDIKSVLMFLSVFRRRVVLYLVLLPFMMSLFIAVYLNLNAGW